MESHKSFAKRTVPIVLSSTGAAELRRPFRVLGDSMQPSVLTVWLVLHSVGPTVYSRVIHGQLAKRKTLNAKTLNAKTLNDERKTQTAK